MRNSQATFNPVADARERLGVSALEAQLLFWMTSAVLFVVLVANQTHIETMEAVKMFPKLELLTRLGGTAAAGLIGIYGALCIGRVQRAMFGLPGLWVVGIAACYVVGAAFSDYKNESLPHLVTFTCTVLFAPTAFAILGSRRFVEVTILALMTTLLASWFLYFFMPEYGVKLEITDGQTGEGVLRMGGTSHPNTLAGVSGFMLMIVTYLLFEKRISKWVWTPIALLCLATYFLTQTRVAAAGAVLAIVFAYRFFWFKRSVFPLTISLGILGICLAAFVLVQGTGGVGAEALTRSGDVEEITSFTGRSDIWAFVSRKIGESPVVGYGPGTAKIYLEQQDMLLHPHNVVLALAFHGGIFCGLFGLGMFLHQLGIALSSKARLAVMLTIYISLNSLTETFIFDYIPGTTTVLWLTALYWPVLDDGSL